MHACMEAYRPAGRQAGRQTCMYACKQAGMRMYARMHACKPMQVCRDADIRAGMQLLCLLKVCNEGNRVYVMAYALQASVAAMLPVLDKFNMQSLMDRCHVWLADPRNPLSTSKGNDAYALR